MNVQEDIPLAPLTTFRMGPVARYLIEVAAPESLPEALAFARERGLPCFVLGGGSNTIFTKSERYEGVVLKMAIRGFSIEDEDDASAVVRVSAGEEWDQVVARTVAHGLSGIEALSAIPGSTGATPIQNVGAYGTEIADVLASVSVYEQGTGKHLELAAADCGFSYRDSIFKREPRYIITGITLRLSKGAPRIPDYPGVKAYFDERGIAEPSLAQVREAIIAIRASKLPSPAEVPSVGSFFKNPIVGRETVEQLRAQFEKPVIFELPDDRHKVGAGWLIDTLGLKGKSFGSLALYPHNALVLTNTGGATYEDLAKVVAAIQAQVEARFGITLEPEPVFVR